MRQRDGRAGPAWPGPRQVFRLLLDAEGWSVSEAANGEEALRVFEEAPESFDCVLLDRSMPKLDGLDVFRRIREARPRTPVALVSGFSEEEILDRLGGARLARVLQKPIPGRKLVTTIREVIAEGAPSREETGVVARAPR